MPRSANFPLFTGFLLIFISHMIIMTARFKRVSMLWSKDQYEDNAQAIVTEYQKMHATCQGSNVVTHHTAVLIPPHHPHANHLYI